MKLKSKWKQSEHSSECQFKFISRRRRRNRRIEIIFNKNTCEKRWRVIVRETDRCRGRERRGTTHVNNKIARACNEFLRSPYRTLTWWVTFKLHIFTSLYMYISPSLSLFLSLYLFIFLSCTYTSPLIIIPILCILYNFTWS